MVAGGCQLPHSSTKMQGWVRFPTYRFYFLAQGDLECMCGQFPHFSWCNITFQALVPLLKFQEALFVFTAVVVHHSEFLLSSLPLPVVVI